MFGFFKKKIKTERRYDVTRIQYELVVMSSRLVSKQTVMFNHMTDKESSGVEGSQFLSTGYITPWVIGYITGILDAVTQTEANKMAFTSEMLELLFAVVFGDDKSQEAMISYIACNEASPPNHAFNVTYEIYMSGLTKAFNEVCEDKQVIGLLNYLMQD
ncbi:TPA: hypothetical protein ACPZRY_001895 [Yersinia enterocolitica]|uniref:hypothetical protein n=1 Tax=Yersinia enterocolitica TaxID=630 RepID=UPI0032FC7C67|nr:hypothetical protein [Yersinia enterocolitica]EKN4809655.1 hypothetical protein [Yersinia enterocolitica]HDL7327885.1 hypothetical protein [Yersinia enterocolitica]HDL7355468.1 hypothetical protein [Yersinia enterocolitica]HDL7959265.1 hypothetical protein [Yersinia enterocolitica]